MSHLETKNHEPHSGNGCNIGCTS